MLGNSISVRRRSALARNFAGLRSMAHRGALLSQCYSENIVRIFVSRGPPFRWRGLYLSMFSHMLGRIAEHPINKIDDLLPWRFEPVN